MHRRRDDPAHGQHRGPSHNGDRDVLFFHHLPPHIEPRERRRDPARCPKNRQPEDGENQGIQRSESSHEGYINPGCRRGLLECSYPIATDRGVGLVVGRQPSKLIYTGSNPVPRSSLSASAS